jgi:hypothetical protein
MKFERKNLRYAAVLVFGVAAIMMVAALINWQAASYRIGASFGATDYATLFQKGGWHRYGLPANLPTAATGVTIYAPAAAPSMLPSPDQYVEVRFFILPIDAAALATSVRLKGISLPHMSFSSTLDTLRTADDGDFKTPLPPEFEHIMLSNPSGSNVGGISINAITGEVVYWVFEQ